MKTTDLAGKKILFIGAGNMAEALVSGALRAGVCEPSCIRVSDINRERLELFQKTYRVGGSDDNAGEVMNADIVVFAVKPQVLPEVLEGVKGKLPEKALAISIAAGITTRAIESILGPETRVIRVMPNSPALVGKGAAALARGSRATEDDARTAAALFESVGVVVRVEEPALDAVTALSGSGPAYVFYLVEAMMHAGEEMGLDPAVAKELVVATVEGAARMLAETGLDSRELRRQVTSEGGTTAAAIGVLQGANVRERFVEAIRAAESRSKELSCRSIRREQSRRA